MVKPDTKQQVLMAIYTEYQKDIPDMKSVLTVENIGIDNRVLNIAIEKLLNEGYINGANPIYGGQSHEPLYVIVDEVKMTRDGIQYVESKMGIEPTLSAGEKLKKFRDKCIEWGTERLDTIAAKAIAEIANHQLDKYS